jgi:hypothetical protein
VLGLIEMAYGGRSGSQLGFVEKKSGVSETGRDGSDKGRGCFIALSML